MNTTRNDGKNLSSPHNCLETENFGEEESNGGGDTPCLPHVLRKNGEKGHQKEKSVFPLFSGFTL